MPFSPGNLDVEDREVRRAGTERLPGGGAALHRFDAVAGLAQLGHDEVTYVGVVVGHKNAAVPPVPSAGIALLLCGSLQLSHQCTR